MRLRNSCENGEEGRELEGEVRGPRSVVSRGPFVRGSSCSGVKSRLFVIVRSTSSTKKKWKYLDCSWSMKFGFIVAFGGSVRWCPKGLIFRYSFRSAFRSEPYYPPRTTWAQTWNLSILLCRGIRAVSAFPVHATPLRKPPNRTQETRWVYVLHHCTRPTI